MCVRTSIAIEIANHICEKIYLCPSEQTLREGQGEGVPHVDLSLLKINQFRGNQWSYSNKTLEVSCI